MLINVNTTHTLIFYIAGADFFNNSAFNNSTLWLFHPNILMPILAVQ